MAEPPPANAGSKLQAPAPRRRRSPRSTRVRPFRRLVSYTARHPTLILSVLAAVLSLAWGSMSIWPGQQAMHSPGPVAVVHEKLDCAACHSRAWQPLERLMARDPRAVRLKMDQACAACHTNLVHHTNEIASEVPNCITCHREHQGPHGLARTGDGSCATCHADLRTVDGPTTRFERKVTAFAHHPEFGVVRRGEPDPGTIAFNHAAHLKPGGILGVDGKLVSLACGACHQPAGDGAYMGPIRFESHCASCHSNALVFDAVRFASRPAPHGQPPEVLRGLLRERYTEYIDQHPEELGAAIRVERPLPGRSGLRDVSREEWAWVNQQLEQADRTLFVGAGGCRYCHPVEATGKGWHIPPTRVPKRWLVSSKFSHFSHRLNPEARDGAENCTACHATAGASSRTVDVLLPSVENCKTCHNGRSLPHTGRTDCVECHTYHHEVGGRGKVDDESLR